MSVIRAVEKAKHLQPAANAVHIFIRNVQALPPVALDVLQLRMEIIPLYASHAVKK